MGIPWTEQDDARLIRMWSVEGLSSSLCASRYGGRFSRSAVIGRIFRLRKLERLPPRPEHLERKTFKRCAKYRQQQERMANVSRKAKRTAITSALLADPVGLNWARTDGVRHTIETLPADLCRWIHGDPRDPRGPEYCAHMRLRLDGRTYPYCAYHCSVAYGWVDAEMGDEIRQAMAACGCGQLLAGGQGARPCLSRWRKRTG